MPTSPLVAQGGSGAQPVRGANGEGGPKGREREREGRSRSPPPSRRKFQVDEDADELARISTKVLELQEVDLSAAVSAMVGLVRPDLVVADGASDGAGIPGFDAMRSDMELKVREALRGVGQKT